MKILILNYEYPPIGGGAGNQTKLLAEEFVRKGHKVRIITSHYKGLSFYSTSENLEIIRVPVFRKTKDRSNFLQMFFYLKMAFIPFMLSCWKWKPDIIFSFFLLPTSILALFQKPFFKIPFVVSLRGADVPSFIPEETKIYKYLRPVANLINKNAEKIVAVSDDLAELAKKDFPETKVKISYIHNGISVSDAQKIKEDKFTLLFVGRLSKQKNLEFVLNSLANVNGDFLFKIIGDGPLKNNLVNLGSKKKLESKVEFLGWQDKEFIFNEMDRADYLVLFSEIEGLSNAGLEAYAHGLPIIASNQPGIKDFVIDGKTGFLIDKNDKKKLVATIVRLIETEDLDLSMNCKNFILEKYNIKDRAEEYLQLFESVK